jgi:UDP-glucose 4-epimerase
MEEPAAVGQVFNVGNDKGISIADLARKIVEMTGSKSEISFVPYSEAYEEGFEDMRIRVPNLNKVRETIGYEPRVQLDEILRRVIEHFLAKKGQD